MCFPQEKEQKAGMAMRPENAHKKDENKDFQNEITRTEKDFFGIGQTDKIEVLFM